MKHICKSFISSLLVLLLIFTNSITVTASNSSTPNNGLETYTVKEINDLTDVQATCEIDQKACVVDVVSDHPYDVVWDYGQEYNDLVSKCDWSLVFDAEYYKKTFPALATLYHNDETMLLEHFQTVGIHEGRQGSESFNVSSYLFNCDYLVYDTFRQNYAAYYIYYMLNYDSEKNINTTAPEGKYANKEVKTQLKTILTAYQKVELEAVSNEREANELYPYKMTSEELAFANYRAFINASTELKGHEWMDLDYVNYDYVSRLFGKKVDTYSENTTANYSCAHSQPINAFRKYKYSEPHYRAILSIKYQNFGCSNAYVNTETRRTIQFEIFTIY